MENKVELLIKLGKGLNWSKDLLPYIEQSDRDADYLQLFVTEDKLPEIESLLRNYITTASNEYYGK